MTNRLQADNQWFVGAYAVVSSASRPFELLSSGSILLANGVLLTLAKSEVDIRWLICCIRVQKILSKTLSAKHSKLYLGIMRKKIRNESAYQIYIRLYGF